MRCLDFASVVQAAGEERKANQERVQKDRVFQVVRNYLICRCIMNPKDATACVHQLDAAIVRTMKARKSLAHRDLVGEVYRQLAVPVCPAWT